MCWKHKISPDPRLPAAVAYHNKPCHRKENTIRIKVGAKRLIFLCLTLSMTFCPWPFFYTENTTHIPFYSTIAMVQQDGENILLPVCSCSGSSYKQVRLLGCCAYTSESYYVSGEIEVNDWRCLAPHYMVLLNISVLQLR